MRGEVGNEEFFFGQGVRSPQQKPPMLFTESTKTEIPMGEAGEANPRSNPWALPGPGGLARKQEADRRLR